MAIDLKVILKAMENQSYTMEDVAKLTDIKVKRLHDVFIEHKNLTWKEFIKLREVIEFDMNQVLNIDDVDNMFMMTEDEYEFKINKITRTIPKQNKVRFVQAIEYLAECFVQKDANNKEK